jgi:hypothetical protein
MNKVLVAFFVVVFFTGCSMLPQKYDNNEYELLARLETSVVMISEQCDSEQHVNSLMPTLEYDARLLHTYSFYIPRNTEVYGIADILMKDVLEFKNQYERNTATPTYCKLKTKLFLSKVRTALEAVAQKPRS